MNSSTNLAKIENQILNYYRRLPADKLEIPEHSVNKGGRGARRQYKLDWRTSFKTIKDWVDTPQKLKRYLLMHPCFGVYTSIGRWSNPTVLRRIKKTRAKLDIRKVRLNPLLSSDYIVDIDLKFMENKQMFVDCYSLLEDLGLKNLELKFTGGGGQIRVPDFYIPTQEDPVARLLECKRKFEEMTDIILAQKNEDGRTKFPVDFEVMNDWPTRVVKMVPNTLSRRGTVVQDVDINKIDSFEPIKIFEPIGKQKNTRIVGIKQRFYDGSVKIIEVEV